MGMLIKYKQSGLLIQSDSHYAPAVSLALEKHGRTESIWHLLCGIDMAFALRELNVDSVPINFLIPIKGTALGNRKPLHPFEALKIVSLYRFVLPRQEIRICGGRMQVLGEFNSMIFLAGADGMITGDYLTTLGRSPEDDLGLVKMYGLRI
jgi:biotin synthase